MNQNSLDAHQLNLQLNTYPNMKELIIAKLQEVGQARMQHIAMMIGVVPSAISGRFGELIKSDRIEIVEKVKIGRNRYSIYKLK